jgi:tetratricopeptide (TPR) repeat protein
MDPTIPEAFAFRGVYLLSHNETERAIDDLTRAINLAHPFSDDGYKKLLCICLVSRGLAYSSEAFSPKALAYMVEHYKPDEFPSALRSNPYVKGSIEDLNRAVSICTDRTYRSHALFYRGVVEKALGRTAEAEKDIQAAKRINPDVK